MVDVASRVFVYNLPLVFAQVPNVETVIANNQIVVDAEHPPLSSTICAAGQVRYDIKRNTFLTGETIMSEIENCIRGTVSEYVTSKLVIVDEKQENINLLIFDRAQQHVVRYNPFYVDLPTSITRQLDVALKDIFSERRLSFSAGDEAMTKIMKNIGHTLSFDTTPTELYGWENPQKRGVPELERSLNYVLELGRRVRAIEDYRKVYWDYPAAYAEFYLPGYDHVYAPCLRNPHCRDAKILEDVRRADEIFENAPRLQQDIIVYRGTDYLYEEDKSFTFTSNDEEVVEAYGQLKLRIRVPAGIPVLFSNTESDLSQVILPRGGTFKIVQEHSDGWIDVEYKNVNVPGR